MKNNQRETDISIEASSSRRKIYVQPAIVAEINLETRAGGTPIIPGSDPLKPDDGSLSDWPLIK